MTSIPSIATSVQNAPSSITVIDQKVIQTSGARDIRDLLLTRPRRNLTCSNDGNSGVSFRGLSSSRTLRLIDGKRVSTRNTLARSLWRRPEDRPARRQRLHQGRAGTDVHVSRLGRDGQGHQHHHQEGHPCFGAAARQPQPLGRPGALDLRNLARSSATRTDPRTSDNCEIGLNYQGADTGWEITAFHNDIKDMLASGAPASSRPTAVPCLNATTSTMARPRVWSSGASIT
ncbi:TonB-dependent receptor plug domain-containing protein [Paracoccus sp. MC1862]|uniref:TonB-dependent receptor plug domain-containing protein n=1 Tax=Paracoccus sp. MC1862 TaxID=2760307 RepID=UPI0015FFC91F|nr:TonB-dependent receptor [Paracoccus sp. MC1862]QQO45551.1 TonB-dependent receptor [Paracoccus sp. MC1862]